jgi:hypothetical protein
MLLDGPLLIDAANTCFPIVASALSTLQRFLKRRVLQGWGLNYLQLASMILSRHPALHVCFNSAQHIFAFPLILLILERVTCLLYLHTIRSLRGLT